jgi:hypothetical protein
MFIFKKCQIWSIIVNFNNSSGSRKAEVTSHFGEISKNTLIFVNTDFK